jgi:hypothetical protein
MRHIAIAKAGGIDEYIWLFVGKFVSASAVFKEFA